MTETTPLQRLLLGSSLFVFTSMILFHHGYHKPNVHPRPPLLNRQLSTPVQSQDPPDIAQDIDAVAQSLVQIVNGSPNVTATGIQTPSGINLTDSPPIMLTVDKTNTESENVINITRTSQTGPISSETVVVSDENYFIDQSVNNDLDSESALKINFQQAKMGECTHALCNINTYRNAPSARQDDSGPCKRLGDCVSVVIKTANRLETALRLVDAILRIYPEMKIIIVDDVNTTYTHNNLWNKLLSESNTLTYLQVLPGVHNGRSLGVRVATSPYVLILEDDFHFTKNTNIKKMLSVLQSTDIGAVAGTIGKPWSFEGALKIYTDNAGAHMRHYPAVHYGSVPGFVNCFLVDVVKTFLLVRKNDITEAGAWHHTWPLFDHLDFAVNMRLANKNIAYCPDVMTEHLAQNSDYRKLQFISMYRQSFLTKWTLQSVRGCTRHSYTSYSPTCDMPTAA